MLVAVTVAPASIAELANLFGWSPDLVETVIAGLLDEHPAAIEVVPTDDSLRRHGTKRAPESVTRYGLPPVYVDPAVRAEQVRRAARRQIELQVVCRTCLARPLDQCRTNTGRQTDSHHPRIKHADSIERGNNAVA